MKRPLIIALTLTSLIVTSNAAVIMPVSVINTNGGNLSNRPIGLTIDGSGLVDVNTTPSNILDDVHANTQNNNYWISASIGSANFSTVTLTYDLGANYDLTNAFLWNYAPSNTADRGITQATFSFSSDNVTYGDAVSLTDFTTHISISNGTNVAGESLSFGGTKADARYVRMTDISSADANYLAFSEIRFEAVPEPSAALFGALGFLALLRRRR